MIKIKKLDNMDNYYVKKIEENKYGILCIIDVYDCYCLNHNFLYRITDNNGSSIKYIYILKDGILYIKI